MFFAKNINRQSLARGYRFKWLQIALNGFKRFLEFFQICELFALCWRLISFVCEFHKTKKNCPLLQQLLVKLVLIQQSPKMIKPNTLRLQF